MLCFKISWKFFKSEDSVVSPFLGTFLLLYHWISFTFQLLNSVPVHYPCARCFLYSISTTARSFFLFSEKWLSLSGVFFLSYFSNVYSFLVSNVIISFYSVLSTSIWAFLFFCTDILKLSYGMNNEFYCFSSNFWVLFFLYFGFFFWILQECSVL